MGINLISLTIDVHVVSTSHLSNFYICKLVFSFYAVLFSFSPRLSSQSVITYKPYIRFFTTVFTTLVSLENKERREYLRKQPTNNPWAFSKWARNQRRFPKTSPSLLGNPSDQPKGQEPPGQNSVFEPTARKRPTRSSALPKRSKLTERNDRLMLLVKM